jgi:hypothetical protein
MTVRNFALLYLPLFVLLPLLTPGQPVRFVAEYIDFRYNEKIFSVNGNYLFVTPSQRPVTLELNYPFPFEMNDLETISVFDMNAGTPVLYTFAEKAIKFTIHVPPGDTLRMNIAYRQRCLSDTLRYILTTTANWQEPLHHVVYRFENFEKGLKPEFNYKPDKAVTRDGRTCYIWTRKEFMPEKDFEIILKKFR